MARLASKFTVTKGGIEYEFEPADEGGYVAVVPLYPSAVSQGESFEEALENIEEALRDCVAVAKELGLEVPRELDLATG